MRRNFSHNRQNTGRHGLTALVLLLTSVTFSCGEGAEKQVETPSARQFLGEWESVSLEIRINSFAGIKDSTVVIIADTSNWIEVMNMLPIRTVFKADQSYFALYRKPDSSLQSRTSGFFELRGADSIIIHKELPNRETLRHAWVKKNKSVYGFAGVVDFDHDGEVDDQLFSLNKRVAY